MASSSIDTVIRRQGTSQRLISIANVNAKAENFAVTFPQGGCSAAYTVSTADAPVLGYLDMDDYTLAVNIEYSQIAAGTQVECGPVGGGTTDPGHADQLRFEMSARGGADSSPHVLHAPDLGDFTGTTYITVIPIHR